MSINNTQIDVLLTIHVHIQHILTWMMMFLALYTII